MNSDTVIESGLQLITRLINRPSVENLDNDIFFNKLDNTDIIEIRGTVNSGVSLLLAKLIARCILPVQYNGLNISVLFINTDNQFQISDLFNVLRTEIRDIYGPVNVNGMVKDLLDNNLVVINCYNYNEFILTLNSLTNIFLSNKKVGLIAIDSISAYYWQQNEELSYNLYVIKILHIVKKVTNEFKVVVLYTKQFNFISKRETMDWHEKKKIIRYEICLTNKNDKTNRFNCDIRSGKDQKQLLYKISTSSIIWV